MLTQCCGSSGGWGTPSSFEKFYMSRKILNLLGFIPLYSAFGWQNLNKKIVCGF
jgi:hypothetical protein